MTGDLAPILAGYRYFHACSFYSYGFIDFIGLQKKCLKSMNSLFSKVLNFADTGSFCPLKHSVTRALLSKLKTTTLFESDFQSFKLTISHAIVLQGFDNSIVNHLTTKNQKRLLMCKKLFLMFLLLCSSASFATPNGAKPGHVAAPAEGFIKTGLLMANGIIDPNNMMLMDMTYHHDVRNRTPAQVEEHRELAIAHFEDTFEIDVADLVNQGRAFFTPFMLSDDMGYRVYSLSDTWVPASGFYMADGGWVLMVTDPNGIEISGGQLIPGGSMAVYGEYYAVPENQSTKTLKMEPIIVHYQSDRFIVPGFYGETPILCDVFHPDWGWGKAQGVALLVPEGSGMNGNTRNVWTFTGSDFSRPYHDVWFE